MSHRALGNNEAEPTSQRISARSAPALRYVHAPTFCFALVLFDDAIPPSIRLVVSWFGDAPSAEQFAVSHGYSRYVIALAAPVLAVVSSRH